MIRTGFNKPVRLRMTGVVPQDDRESRHGLPNLPNQKSSGFELPQKPFSEKSSRRLHPKNLVKLTRNGKKPHIR